jgi:hypothetical protein
MKYTRKQIVAFLYSIRDQGWAVCAFTPNALRGADPDNVEDRMCEIGNAVIDMNDDDEFVAEDEEEGEDEVPHT